MMMLRNRRLVWKQTVCLLALISSLALGSLATAGKPTKPGDGGGSDGGGETTPVPPGTIHFTQSTSDSWYYADMTMLADGSAKTQVGLSEQGNWLEPSHQLHGDQRWFLTARETGEVDQYGYAIQELFAVTVAGDSTQLTDNANLYVHNIRWGKDDSFFSYVAYDMLTEEEDLHVVDVDWSLGSPLIGLPRKVLSTLYSVDGLRDNYLGAYDWSPAGDQLVYNDIRDWDNHEVRVATFLETGGVETRYIGSGWYPTWSPDGNWIAFGKGGIWKIRPDGSNLVQLATLASGQSHTDQVWSPDSQHLAFTQETRSTTTKRGVTTTTYTYDILRISASGGTATNLTSDTTARCWSVGWR